MGTTLHPACGIPIDEITPEITIIYCRLQSTLTFTYLGGQHVVVFQWSTTRTKHVDKTRVQRQRSNYIRVAWRDVARALTLANRRIGVLFRSRTFYFSV